MTTSISVDTGLVTDIIKTPLLTFVIVVALGVVTFKGLGMTVLLTVLIIRHSPLLPEVLQPLLLPRSEVC